MLYYLRVHLITLPFLTNLFIWHLYLFSDSIIYLVPRFTIFIHAAGPSEEEPILQQLPNTFHHKSLAFGSCMLCL